jgi:hypothetical protein
MSSTQSSLIIINSISNNIKNKDILFNYNSNPSNYNDDDDVEIYSLLG